MADIHHSHSINHTHLDTSLEAPPPLTPPPTTHRFDFRGNGMDYFKIWIVNLVLTIITLGIYSPWAKVRRLRYFYGNTVVANNSFDFTANPKRILIGRVIAIAIYLLISISGQFSPEMAIAGSVIIFAIVPWLIRSTLRFMARNSQYNNVRFGFGGKLGSLYGLFIGMLILGAVSFGLLLPAFWYAFKRYQFDNTYFGQLKFHFNATIGDFYKAVFLPFLLLIALALALGAVGFLLSQVGSGDGLMATTVIGIVSFYIAMLLVLPLMQGYVYQAIWGKLTLGENRFELVNFSPLKFAWIHLSNYIAIICSLGLLYPWTQVRLHRYKMQTLSLVAVQDFATLATPHADNVSAVGEEISDVFDFDISW